MAASDVRSGSTSVQGLTGRPWILIPAASGSNVVSNPRRNITPLRVSTLSPPPQTLGLKLTVTKKGRVQLERFFFQFCRVYSSSSSSPTKVPKKIKDAQRRGCHTIKPPLQKDRSINHEYVIQSDITHLLPCPATCASLYMSSLDLAGRSI